MTQAREAVPLLVYWLSPEPLLVLQWEWQWRGVHVPFCLSALGLASW